MVRINNIDVTPPLINTSCAWASDKEQLQALFDCPHTGAVTTRTATADGFAEDASHTVVFSTNEDAPSSLNSYGYSPHPLRQYLDWIAEILSGASRSTTQPTLKPFIISITSSSPDSLRDMVAEIQVLRHISDATDPTVKPYLARIAIELNTSCPNIVSAPPPAYAPSEPAFTSLLAVLADAYRLDPSLTIGLKLPPFIYEGQFHALLAAVSSFTFESAQNGKQTRQNPFAFFTSTNTLGNSLFFTSQTDGQTSLTSSDFALPTPLGGLAGSSLHPLALGNVFTFTKLLAASRDTALQRIAIIGVGGVTDAAAARRMHGAGALVVGAATMLGKDGVAAFEKLSVRN